MLLERDRISSVDIVSLIHSRFTFRSLRFLLGIPALCGWHHYQSTNDYLSSFLTYNLVRECINRQLEKNPSSDIH